MHIANLTSWTDFKSIVSSKMLLMQYIEGDTFYEVFTPEDSIIWQIRLTKGESDCDDFDGTGFDNRHEVAEAELSVYRRRYEAENCDEATVR